VFTSGATEANNLALLGGAESDSTRRHLVTQATEHPSVLEPMRRLAARGWELTLIGVAGDGRIDLDELEAALRDDTVLVSLMLANNETGCIQPVARAAALAHLRGALLHCDAAQGPGKLPLDVAELGVDMLTVSGHKVYGPKGIGALYLRRQIAAPRTMSQIVGGGHERGLRSGTPNLPGAVGLARALEIARAELEAERQRIGALRDHFEQLVGGGLEGCSVNGAAAERLANTSNLSFAGIDGTALLASLPDLAVSTGSACASAHPEASAVLLAMGVPERLAAASIRVSLGRFTTAAEVERAAERLVREIVRLRGAGSRRRP
jgi:cysteine desulfurase